MKEIFDSLARYNRSVNESVKSILAGLSKEQMAKDTGAFYHSLNDTCVHLLIADIFYLKSCRSAFPENGPLKNSGLLARKTKDIMEEVQGDREKTLPLQIEVDALIEQFINSLAEGDFSRMMQFGVSRDQSTEKPAWKILLNWFNHQTHHRGQISVQLDLLGIDNDFSTMMARI